MPCGIYKFENLITGQIYIGQSIDLQARYKKHKSNMYDMNHTEDLYIAFREYGFDNFSYEILESFEVFNSDQLNELECKYISQYNSMTPNGYNMVPGGSNGAGLLKRKPVFQFDLYGNFIKEYPSAKEAAEAIKVNHSLICRCARRETLHTHGYQWSYYRNDETICDISSFIVNRDKEVLQLDLQTNEIFNIFPSLTEASKATGIAKSTISKACRGMARSAGGFAWKYSHLDIEPYLKVKNGKAVLQFHKNGTYMREYASISEAGRVTGINISNISQVCLNKRKTAGGYKWKFKE